MSPKNRQFIAEYLVDLNATKAALRAGYSEKTAYSQGQRLLKNAEIAAAIVKALEERAERTRIDADWVLRRLSEEMEADVADLYDEAGKVKPIREWPKIWRQGLVAGIESFPERIGEDEDGNPVYSTGYKLKLASRDKRLEMLGKHVYVNAFREKVDHTSSDGSMSPPSLADFYGGGEPKKADDA